MDQLDLARIQFATTSIYHFLFVPITMGLAIQPVVDWAGDPARVLDYQVRFTRPVPVDPDLGAVVTVVAKVGTLDADAGVARIDLTVTFNSVTVLGKAQARVSLI